MLLFFVLQFGFSQTDSDYQNALITISKAFNSKDSNTLFASFSSELQSTFVLEKVNDFLNENYEAKGTMGEFTLLVEDDDGRRYLTEFENASSVIFIVLSQDKKITKFAIEEY